MVPDKKADAVMDDTFYSQGLRFSCERCSYCCRIEPGCVYLSENDLTNLCKWFNLNEAEFVRSFCRAVYNSAGEKVLGLKEKPNYDCILWDRGCTAYGSRPLQCSTYPFWPFIVQNRERWHAEARDCPGINKGTLHSAEEIENALLLYRRNIPLKYAELRRVLKETEL